MPNKTLFEVPHRNRYFEDYTVGTAYEFGVEEVTEQEIISFAERYDPQFIHVDPVAAANGPFGGLIASGWLTAGLTMRLFIGNFYNERAGLGGAGIEELRFLEPVRPGDMLSLRCTVQSKRVSRSKPDRGVLTFFLETLRQDMTVVATMTTTSIMLLRGSGPC
ncbi:MaoC family dehydratase [Arthrobacter sp. ISL-95]|uniref:MaoC family dehydratase n=1 Tax=Arthrobacter sp. ISL-95 TaxID=2819116 RepID=UPI001BEA66FB|nr:MaoC family dehydratase [Arthrobacter sp. ISL-95]MBT2585387.1 MaoC family dehydratase [Arthrobacter sp. ISL-95]